MDESLHQDTAGNVSNVGAMLACAAVGNGDSIVVAITKDLGRCRYHNQFFYGLMDL